jgi:uncharacterized oxidoreductase
MKPAAMRLRKTGRRTQAASQGCRQRGKPNLVRSDIRAAFAGGFFAVTVSVPFDRLVDFVTAIFAASGCDAGEAHAVAYGLAEANLVGHDSHGVLRAPIYLSHLDAGIVKRGQRPQLVADNGSVVTFDGGGGLGQVACEEVMDCGIAKAKQSGAAAIGLRNVGHLGRIGRWAEKAANEGILSLHFVNTSGGSDAEVMLVAPFGGRDRRMSVNPMCIGLPRPGKPPIVMDATMAATAGGKVMAALNRGDDLPPGQIIDKTGKPSVKPKDLFDGGAILPFGDHRGYALCFMIDVLAGALTGGGTSPQPRHPRMNNMASIFIDPERISGANFESDLEAYAGWMKAAPTVTPGGEVLLPGEMELRVAAKRRQDGVPIDDTTLSQLQGLATRFKLPQLKVGMA